MPKSLILLMDGTGNDATSDSFSNVYALNQIIAESKKIKSGRSYRNKVQITFYLPGIGTRFTVSRLVERSSLFKIVEKVRENVFGDNLEQLVIRGYVNISANYRQGDDVILIGFSRGAAAARILSRFVSDFGILRSDKLDCLDTLWNEFTTISQSESDGDYHSRITDLKRRLQPGDREPLFHENLGKPIKFLGVFDTVVGPMDDELYRNIYFRDSVVASGVESVVHLMSLHEMRKEFVLQRFHRGSEGNSSALVREIWVPGVHSDIGGGYEENFISNICLLTMSEMLSQYADIALDPSGYRGILQQIQAKIGAYRIVVNKEPSIPNKESRKGDVHKGDELHPLHRYLVDKHIVWKHSTNTEKYYDEYADIGYKIDKKIAKHFEKWID